MKLSAGIILAGFAVLWDKMVRSDREMAAIRQITLPYNPNRDFTFHDDFIIIKKNDDLQVFSSRCTHLGCIIRSIENEKLICPCHGSTFNSDGHPEKGPAVKPLKKLAYQLDNSNQQITIEL